MREVERDLLEKREDAARVLKELKRSNMKTHTPRRRWDGEGGKRDREGDGREGEVGGRDREGGGTDREVGGKDREGGTEKVRTEREVGGLEREVVMTKREVLGTKREVGGTEREVGGMNLAFLLNITTALKKGKFYVLQAFVIIFPELVSFYGQN